MQNLMFLRYQNGIKKSTEVHGGMGFDLLGLHYWFKIGLNRHILGSPEIVRKEAAKVQGL